MTNVKKWLVTFTVPKNRAAFLKEEVIATDWMYAKLALESKYNGIKILNYTPIN